MSITKILTTTLLVSVFGASLASAQSLREASTPAEFPPASYEGRQYIDSNGCVYLRAGISGNVTWVPRVTRNRQVMCGFEPTLGGRSVASAPVIPDPVGTPPPVETNGNSEGPARVVIAAPAPESVGPPIETVATLSPPPATTPVAGDGGIVAPVFVPQPTPTAAPARLTRADICAGRTGVQPNYVSSRTGQPINCGGTPAPTPVAAPIAPVPTAEGTIVTTTRAQICAGGSEVAARYVNRRTGLPVRCGPQTQPIVTPGTGRSLDGFSGATGYAAGTTGAGIPTGTITGPIPTGTVLVTGPANGPAPGTIVRTTEAQLCAGASALSTQYINRSTGAPVRCGPQTQPIVTVVGGSGGSAYNGGGAIITGGTDYTTGANAFVAPTSPPEGFQTAWDDGRLNALRGLPVGTRVVVTTRRNTGFWGSLFAAPSATTEVVSARDQAAPTTEIVSTRTAPPPAAPIVTAPAHQYVQVATFGSSEDAQIVAQRLRNLGLPMRIGRYERGGQTYRIVMSGPFSSQGALTRALSTVRGSGYPSATTRQ